MKRSTLHILIAGCILALYTVGSTMEFHDEQLEADHYCDMVEQGAWPDYRGTFDEECAVDENEVRVSKDIGNEDW